MTNLHDVTETLTISHLERRVRARRRGSRRRRTPGVLAHGLLGALGAFGSAACSPPPAQMPVVTGETPAEPERSAWPEAPKPESVVHAEFQTSAQAVKPRGTFLLAVRFDIEEGYRISWQNPGDVGKTTRVTFEVPEGFSVGPLQYPAPRRFELPGKLISYGYERQTAIFAEVTAPDRLPDGHTYRFDVKADWLACKNECASEELSAWFELASSALAPEPELPAELAPYQAAVPAAFADLPDSNLDWKGGPAHPALTLKAADVKWVDFFPGDGEQPKLLAMKIAGDELRLKFARASTSKPMRGLAVAEVDGKTSFYDVNVPWPTE
jgi:DsbC/DsbD-like thiol-disulfide interchange protein